MDTALDGLLAQAVHLHRAGRWQPAAELCAQILAADPRNHPALHLLGLIAAQLGSPENAVQLLGRAIQLQSRVASYHNDLGVVYRKLGQVDRAAACYREAVRLEADFAEAHCNLANLLRERGMLRRAAAVYRRALKLRPGFVPAWMGLGICLDSMGRAEPALSAYQSVLELQPDCAEAHDRMSHLLRTLGRPEAALRHFQRLAELQPDSCEAQNNLGAQLQAMGKTTQAEPYFRRALELSPEFNAAQLNLAKALRELRRLPEAEACLRSVLRRRPDCVEALDLLGIVLSDRRRWKESLACLQRALQLAPERPATHCNLGHALLLQERYDEAESHLRFALQRQPDFLDAWNNLGGVLHVQALLRRGPALADAEHCFRRALEIQPGNAEIHVNLGMHLLLQGRYSEGWKEWEWRWRFKDVSPDRFPQPLWQGESLHGRCILLHAEQGFGDSIQFVRFAAPLKLRAGRVLLLCPGPLRKLFAGCQGVDLVLDQTQNVPWFDYHAPLMNLPGLLETTLDNLPAAVPYLRPDPDRVAEWKARLGVQPGFKLGLAWQGNPQFKGDRIRSIPLAQFAPLARLAGVRLFSLQTGYGREQISEVAQDWPLVDLGLPFAEKAAAMMNLDLIVTSDSAVAHLAGALGRPVWLAVSYTPDWRWFADRRDSPWYPTLRLFRQPGPRQWPAVFAAMAGELQERLRRKNSAS